MPVEGLGNVLKRIEEVIHRFGKGDTQVAVGYSADYAVIIHEDITRHHPNGQAQYLIQPAREMKDELGDIVKKALKDGETVEEALLKAGNALLEASQQLVPYQTGFLHDSGFVETED